MTVDVAWVVKTGVNVIFLAPTVTLARSEVQSRLMMMM